MENLTIQKAEERDWAYIQEKMGKYLLDAEGADWPRFHVARRGDKTVAFGRIIDHGDYFEIASFGVDYYHRGKGTGVKLLKFLIEEAKRQGPEKEIYGVTHRPGFVKKAGFESIEGAGPEAMEQKKHTKCKDPSRIHILRVRHTAPNS